MQESLAKAGVLIEALPYIRSFFGKTFVIKYGGSAQKEEALKQAFAQDVALMNFIGVRPVVVHGGGPKISEIMARMGKKAEFIHGHRVTDEDTMDIVEMVLGGLVNKEIVKLINHHGGRAVGLSGKDGNLIMARRKMVQKTPGSTDADDLLDIGLVGEVTSVNPEVLDTLDMADFIPVIAPVGVGPLGETFNINADDITAAIATSVRAEKLIYLTDVAGILDSNGQVIPSLNRAKAEALIASGEISGGMIPKVTTALNAIDAGVAKVHIVDGRMPHCLLLEIFTKEGIGTEITA
jgi:acetylglutamate kinase